MDILYILIPVAILLLAFATWAFFWSPTQASMMTWSRLRTASFTTMMRR